MRKAQAAFEYLMLLGVALILIIPGSVLFYNYSLRSADELARSKVHLVGSKLVESVEKVYFIGEGSWETVRAELPERTAWIYVLNNSEIVIGYNTHVGVSEAIFFSDINITTPYLANGINYFSPYSGDDSGVQRLMLIKVSSMGNHVIINETK